MRFSAIDPPADFFGVAFVVGAEAQAQHVGATVRSGAIRRAARVHLRRYGLSGSMIILRPRCHCIESHLVDDPAARDAIDREFAE